MRLLLFFPLSIDRFTPDLFNLYNSFVCMCVYCATSLDFSKTITYAKCRKKKIVVSVSMRSDRIMFLKSERRASQKC